MHTTIKNLFGLIPGVYSYNITSKFKSLTPKKLLVVLTYKCNSRCIMCNIWKMKPNQELSIKEWKKILNDPIFSNIEKLNITGGEALLSPNCLPLIQLFIKNMPKLYYIDIVTNGFETNLIKIKIATIAAICKNKNISFSVSVSLDGIEKTHETIRRIPYAFKKNQKTINILQKMQKKYNFSLSVGSVVMKQTLSEVHKLTHWAKKHNIKQYFQLVGFHGTFVNNLDTKNTINFTIADKPKLLNLLNTLGTLKNWKDLNAYYWKDMYFMYKYNLPRSSPCPYIYDEFYIDATGDVYYCLSEKSIGNVKNKSSVSEIYFHPKNLKFRKRMQKTSCLFCNSDCNVRKALAYDFKKYMWFYITGIPWYGLPFHIRQIKNHLHKK